MTRPLFISPAVVHVIFMTAGISGARYVASADSVSAGARARRQFIRSAMLSMQDDGDDGRALLPYPFGGEVTGLHLVAVDGGGGRDLIHLPKTALAATDAEINQGLNGRPMLADDEGLFMDYRARRLTQQSALRGSPIPADTAWFGRDGVLLEVARSAGTRDGTNISKVAASAPDNLAFGLKTRPGLLEERGVTAGQAQLAGSDVVRFMQTAVRRRGECSSGASNVFCARPGVIPPYVLIDIAHGNGVTNQFWSSDYDTYYDSHPELGPGDAPKKYQIIKASKLQGYGIIVTQPIKKDEKIDASIHVLGDPRKWTADTVAGMQCKGDGDVCHVPPWFGISMNHCSVHPSTYKVLEPLGNTGWWSFYQVAKRDLAPGDEITGDFNEVFEMAPMMNHLLQHAEDSWTKC